MFISVPKTSQKSTNFAGLTRHTYTYDLSAAMRHSLQISIWQFVFQYRWFIWLYSAGGGILLSRVFADWLFTAPLTHGFCFVIGALIFLVGGFFGARESIVENEMEKMAVKARGGKREDWKCVREKKWEGFVSSLSSQI